MKKFCLFIIIILCAVIFCGCKANTTVSSNDDLLRLHIRADSNAKIDQDVKLKVRDKVNAYVCEFAVKAKDFSEALELVQNNLSGIEKVADLVLSENGFNYRSKAYLAEEYFPTRKYDNVTVEAGMYSSLIIELGSGEGDNWWCVIYPPLCYGELEPQYKSFIKEWIDSL